MAAKPTKMSPSDAYFKLLDLEAARANNSAKTSDEEIPAASQTSSSSRCNQAAVIAFGTISAITYTAAVVYACLILSNNTHGRDDEYNHDMLLSAGAFAINAAASSIYGAINEQLPKFLGIGVFGPFNLVWGACKLAGKM